MKRPVGSRAHRRALHSCLVLKGRWRCKSPVGWSYGPEIAGWLPAMDSTEEHPGGRAKRPKQTLQKVTIYVRPEQVIKLEEIQLQERRRTGVRPDKSALVQQALDLLIRHYGI